MLPVSHTPSLTWFLKSEMASPLAPWQPKWWFVSDILTPVAFTATQMFCCLALIDPNCLHSPPQPWGMEWKRSKQTWVKDQQMTAGLCTRYDFFTFPLSPSLRHPVDSLWHVSSLNAAMKKPMKCWHPIKPLQQLVASSRGHIKHEISQRLEKASPPQPL
jgi:hypothetical protein